MARVSTDAIVACLDDIRAGRRSLEQCAAENPEAAVELRQLSSVVASIRTEDAPLMDEVTRLRGRAQLLAVIGSNGHRPAEERAALAEALSWPARLRGVLAIGPRWAAALAAGLTALTAGGAVVYAAQSAMPDSPLFPIREAVQVVAQTILPAPPQAPPASPITIERLQSAPPAARSEQGQSQPSSRRIEDERGPASDNARRRDETPESRGGQSERRDERGLPGADRRNADIDRQVPEADEPDRRDAEQRSFEGRPSGDRDRGDGRSVPPSRIEGRGAEPTSAPSRSATPGRDSDRRGRS